MEYLKRVLGIGVVYKDDKLKSMPSFINARYRMQKVRLDGKEAVFLYPKRDLDAVSAVKKHIAKIQNAEGVPVILVLDRLAYRQKEYLIRERIPFIVDGKQIYLPFLALYLQERCDGDRQTTEDMLPSAQLLMLYYIYNGCGELWASVASEKLGMTSTSISRASRQLEEMGLIHTHKQGVQKVISSGKEPEEMFLAARRYFRNPVKRTIYVPKAEMKGKLLISGYQALAEYSMLIPSEVSYMASDSISAWESVSSGKLQNPNDQCAVELWRYDPKKLSDGECVDRLSLAVSLKEDRDERIEEAVDEMLEQLWRDIDGKGN